MGIGEKMQTDNAEQGSRFKMAKTVSYWVIGTVAAVPLTKMVESYYDVSFFSPAILGLKDRILSVGTWLSQTVPLQMWFFWVVTLIAILGATFGIWAIRDKRLEVGAAKAEQKKAYEKAREANGKFNAVDATLNATTKELKAAKLELDAARSELKAAQVKIADLQTPKVQPLTESHHIVLAGIMIYDNADKPCYVKDLSQKIHFTMVQTEGAVDVLVKRKLVDEYYTNGGRGVSLTADGRAYVLHPDFDMSHLPL